GIGVSGLPFRRAAGESQAYALRDAVRRVDRTAVVDRQAGEAQRIGRRVRVGAALRRVRERNDTAAVVAPASVIPRGRARGLAATARDQDCRDQAEKETPPK